MYPNLYFIIKKLTGWTPPEFLAAFQTYGLFLAITFIVGGYIVFMELGRKHKAGLIPQIKLVHRRVNVLDGILNALIGFILGYKVGHIYNNYDAFIDNPQNIVFSANGNWTAGIVLAIVFAGVKVWEWYSQRNDKSPIKEEWVDPQNTIGDLVIVAAISGIIGSKVMALLEVWDEFLKNPVQMLFDGSGIAIYGGLIGGFIGVYFYARSRNFKMLHLMDAAAPALLLGYGTGRMGCHFSGDGDWGIINETAKPFSWLPDWMWSYNYPNNVMGASASTLDEAGRKLSAVPMGDCGGFAETFPKYCFELPKGVYPTSVYETLIMVVAFAIFWWVLRKRINIAGLLFFFYLIVNGMERFWIERFRVNDRYSEFFDFSQAQIIAVTLFTIGAIGSAWLIWQHKKRV